MDATELIVVAAGGGAAGFVAGLTGLGTALTSLTFWLFVLPPGAAVPMAAMLAVTAHIVTLSKIRHGIRWERLRPFLFGGAVGMPLGVWVLPFVSAPDLKLALGIFLLLYCGYGLFVKVPPVYHGGGKVADGAVGIAGGFLGGVSGASGPLPTIWSGIRGWPKDEARGVYQPFNLMVLGSAAVGHMLNGQVAVADTGRIALALGIGIGGALLGLAVYRRVDDAVFRRMVLAFLLIAGLVHTVQNIG